MIAGTIPPVASISKKDVNTTVNATTPKSSGAKSLASIAVTIKFIPRDRYLDKPVKKAPVRIAFLILVIQK